MDVAATGAVSWSEVAAIRRPLHSMSLELSPPTASGRVPELCLLEECARAPCFSPSRHAHFDFTQALHSPLT